MLRERRLFRMFLRCLGVYFIGRGLVDGMTEVGYDLIDQTWLIDWSLMGLSWMYDYLSPLASLAVGAYLLFAGTTLVNWVAPVAPARCWECGYDLTGNRSGRCTECGVPYPGSGAAQILHVERAAVVPVHRRAIHWTPHLFIAAFLAWALLCAAHVIYLRLEGEGLCGC